MTSLHMEPTVVMALDQTSSEKPFKYRNLICSNSKLAITTFCAAWLITMPLFSHAETWKVEPRIQVSETYTDNVRLASAGQEKSDFIIQINPGISLQRKGGRSDIFLDYSIQTRVYANERESNSLSNQLSARSRTEVMSDFMFFDASANVAQQNTSLLGPVGISASENTNDNNTAETRSYVISPSIRDRISSSMSYEARYQRDYVGSDSNNLSNSDSDKFFFNLRSGEAFNRFGWGLNYVKEKVDYSSSEDYKTETTTFDGRWGLNPRFSLIGTIGYEKNDYFYIGEKPYGKFWTAGILWKPSNLTSLSLSTGKRFYGTTKALDFSRRSKRFVWTASYSEDITSTRENFLVRNRTPEQLNKQLEIAYPDPVQRTELINEYLAVNDQNFFTNQVFLQKRFNSSVVYNSGKTIYIFNTFKDRRDAQTIGSVSMFLGTSDFGFSNNILQTGSSFFINYRFAPKTSVNFELGETTVEYLSTDREDTLKTINTGVSHQFSLKTSGSLNVRHVQHKSNFSIQDYKENAIIGALTITF